MNLIKYNKLNEIMFLEKAFDKLLKSRLDTNWLPQDYWSPETDIIETNTEIKIQMECPGISLENINVSYKDNRISIRGEKVNETKVDNKNYHKIERSFGSFTRSFPLPVGIEEESIKAEYENGLLTITAIKDAGSKTKKIEIQNLEQNTPKVLSASDSSG